MTIYSISPTQGSTAGGVQVMIHGSGFGNVINDVLVHIGSATCDVTSVNMSTIICTTSSHTATNVSLNVSFSSSYSCS